MTDVLAISVALQGPYASNNALGKDGFRGGRKSDAYKALFLAVKEAAEAEALRTGWESTACEHDVSIVRYMPKRTRADASNLGKCEMDSLTAAGIWPDDRFANPFRASIRYHDGPHRVSIVVMKLYEPANRFEAIERPKVAKVRNLATTQRPSLPSASAPSKPPSRRDLNAHLSWKSGDPIPPGYALLGSSLIPLSEALGLVAGKGTK